MQLNTKFQPIVDCLSLCGFFGHGLREEIELFLQWTRMTQRQGLRISEKRKVHWNGFINCFDVYFQAVL